MIEVRLSVVQFLQKQTITKAADRNRLEGTCPRELHWIYNICSMQPRMPPPFTTT